MIRLALLLTLAAAPLLAQVHSTVRIPVTKQTPAVVTVIQLDTLTLFSSPAPVSLVTDSLVVDTLVLDHVARSASFRWWLGLAGVGAGALVGIYLTSHGTPRTPPDTLVAPVTVTPEPGSFGLMLGGLVVLALVARRDAVREV